MVQPRIFVIGTLPDFLVERLNEAFEVHYVRRQSAHAVAPELAPTLRAIVATGESVVDRALLDSLPAVEIVAVFGVGYDGIDVAAARERNIVVSHTPGVLTDDVADLALALLLSVARKVAAADRFVRRGGWPKGPMPLAAKVSGSCIGIIGLGRIGKAIAKRAEAFGMVVAYTDLRPLPDVRYAYHPTALALARAVDFLIVSAYGGPSTQGMVNADILAALGPRGFLVNIARGALVDEGALVEALVKGTIAGAGLDVFAHEPKVPPALLEMENVVLTPHMASATEETRHAMADLVVGNLLAHFAGEPLLTPVPVQ